MRAALGLGSNLDPEHHLCEAVARLRALGELVALSSVYESPPAGGAHGPDFLNAAAVLETTLDDASLRRELRTIERDLGRLRPAERGAPRTIDLDVLFVDREPPHPDLLMFAHVAVPLAEVLPDYVHPKTQESLPRIAARLEAETPLTRRMNLSF